MNPTVQTQLVWSLTFLFLFFFFCRTQKASGHTKTIKAKILLVNPLICFFNSLFLFSLFVSFFFFYLFFTFIHTLTTTICLQEPPSLSLSLIHTQLVGRPSSRSILGAKVNDESRDVIHAACEIGPITQGGSRGLWVAM